MPETNDLIKNIPIDVVDLNPEQSRQTYDEEALDELAQSISKIGLINPITVCISGGRYKLIAGSRRLRACELNRSSFIRAFVLEENDPNQLSIMAHENLFRADLSPVEESNFFARLLAEKEITVPQLIHLTGKRESYIMARLRLIQCSEETKELVHSGKLSISAALELYRFGSNEIVQQYTAYAISSGASLQTIKYWRQQLEANASIPPSDGDTPPAPVQQGQQTVFGWYCYSCGNFHSAQQMQTIHICQPCFIYMEKAKVSTV